MALAIDGGRKWKAQLTERLCKPVRNASVRLVRLAAFVHVDWLTWCVKGEPATKSGQAAKKACLRSAVAIEAGWTAWWESKAKKRGE